MNWRNRRNWRRMIKHRFFKPAVLFIGYVLLWFSLRDIRTDSGLTLFAVGLFISVGYLLLPEPEDGKVFLFQWRRMYFEIAAAMCFAACAALVYATSNEFDLGRYTDITRFLLITALPFFAYWLFIGLVRILFIRCKEHTAAQGSLFIQIRRAVPYQWRALLISACMFAFCIFLLSPFRLLKIFPLLLAVSFLFLLLAWAHIAAIEEVRKQSERMARGNWDMKEEDSPLFLLSDIRRNLKGVAAGAQSVVSEQLRSERMKAELIANVSHDIRTPLTSMINYADLLSKKEMPDRQAAQYLEVLAQKSRRLKTLLSDLLDASRAGSGDMQVSLAPLDLVELQAQILSDFEKRLESKRLTLVCTAHRPVMVMGDGRHLWRVMENLLGNIVAYAQPGTRVYFDIKVTEGHARLIWKNVSAAPLNISASELMERFVRGDTARRGEGCGLGLFIARSLMELQGGKLELHINGDLFESVLSLPLAPVNLEEKDSFLKKNS